MSEKHGLDKEGMQLIKQFGLDALSLLTHVNYELNMQRKHLMKPDKLTHFFSAESKKLQRPNIQILVSQGVSKDEPKQEAITVAHALNTVNCGVQNFVAGNIAHPFSDWRSITSDPSILEIVSGYRIDFERLPCQTSVR